MPVKSRKLVEAIGPRRVEYTHYQYDRKEWDPACEKSPEETSGITYDKASEDVPSGTWVYRSEFLHYGNSDFKGSNSCIHIVRHTDSEATLLRARNLSDKTDTYPYEGCGKYDFTKHRQIDNRDLKISLDIADVDPHVERHVNTHDLWFTESPYDVVAKMKDLERLAWEAMLPRLDDGWSAPRAIYELVELISLVGVIRQLVTKLPEAVLKLFKRPISQLSQHYLTSIFGVLPLISDSKEFVHRFYSVADRVLDYVEQQNVRRTMHFQKALSPATFQPPEWFGPFSRTHELDTHEFEDWHFAHEVLPDYFTVSTEFSREIQQAKYHNTLEYTYTLPFSMDRGLQTFLGELDVYGFNLSISDFWEIVPFSFVVDWIFDVGSWLSRFDFLNLPPTVVVWDQSRSIKYFQKDLIHYVGCGPEPWYPVNTLRPARQDWRVYYREAGIRLPELRSLEIDVPSGMQLLTGAALIASRRK